MFANGKNERSATRPPDVYLERAKPLRSMISFALIAVTLTVAIVATGCGWVSSVDKIYGKYSLKKPEADVELELLRNMRFKETIEFASGQTVELTGRWRFDVIDNDGDVDLDGVARLSKELRPDSIERINTGMEAQRLFGRIRLCADANDSLYFVKVESR